VSFVQPDFDALVNDLRPGLLDSPESDALPPGATPDGANCAFDRVGARASLKKRNGHRLLNPLVLPGRVDGFIEFTRPGFPPEMIVVANGLVWKFNSGSSAFEAVTDGEGFTAGHRARFVIFRTQLYIFDGTHQLRYDGTACFPIGFDEPTGAIDMTAAAATGDGVVGTFEAIYVWYDSVSDHESSPTDATAVLVLAPPSVTPSSTNTAANSVAFGSAHGLVTGDQVTASTSAGGLYVGFPYYVRALTSTTLAFYTTSTDASGDTNRVDLTATIAAALVNTDDADQGGARLHTQPTGSPPDNVDKWRAYVRRVDTYEANFYLAGTFDIADPTGTEQVIDAARRDIGPLTGSNDPPPAFIAMTAWRGYVLGIEPDDFNLSFSKQGDGQSWHPKEVFPVRAGGRDLRSVKVFGTEALVQTPRRTFHLVGSRVPFAIEELSSEWGNVSPDAGVEVGDYFYAWDEQRGPYRTNTLTWDALADNRIEGVLATVNRAELRAIRAEVFPKANLVVWMVTTGTLTRSRTLIAYDYLLNAWLPPLTGMEYTALARFTDTTGDTGFYIGDEWGRIYELLSGTVDGPPSGTLIATVTAGTPDSVTCAGAAFYTGGDGLAGMPVAVLSPSGALQWRRIRSNNASMILLDVEHDNPWTVVPQANPDSFDDGALWDTAIWDDEQSLWNADPQTRRPGDWLVLVGGIDWYFTTPWFNFTEPDVMKRGAYLMLQGRAQSSGDTVITAAGRFNDVQATARTYLFTFSHRDDSAVWDEGVWDVSAWGGGSSGARKTRKQRIARTFHTCQFRFSNPFPAQDFTLVAYRITADRLARRRGRNV
jgi:hypothetical protein